MKKKLYFVIEKGVYEDGETLDGNKTIICYEIMDNIPKEFCQIECELSDKNIDQIQEYLYDNGHGDEDFEFIQL